ncbi:hypothetical protein [Streptomyces sp. NPDC048639]|uniref:hypothetical protein n=1 Tax=Streptomyces sp. NPDC048639 TaxID=3365581 RepID=UPI00371C3B94
MAAVHATHELRAEHRAAAPGQSGRLGGLGPVKTWHMVRGSGTTAMCGRALDPVAASRPEEDWGRTREICCHTCGALYLREVP